MGCSGCGRKGELGLRPNEATEGSFPCHGRWGLLREMLGFLKRKMKGKRIIIVYRISLIFNC